MIQKSFFISSDIFADKTFKGIVEVLDEIIEEGLRASCILEYIECLISILSTTASTTQSASETTEKSSSIFPVLINSFKKIRTKIQKTNKLFQKTIV